MATIEVMVIGPFEVNDTAPGEVTELDDEVLNVPALVESGHVDIQEMEPGQAEETPSMNDTKDDLVEQAEALGLDTSGTKADLIERINEALEAN